MKRRSATSGISASAMAGEVSAGITQRPGRSILTMLGTMLGIGAFVAIIGISQTASGQISKQFNLLDATAVTVYDQAAAASTTAALSFPDDSEQLIDRLNGVQSSCVWWPVVTVDQSISRLPSGPAQQISVYAATPGVFAASGATMAAGTAFNSFHNQSQASVIVLSKSAAMRLGISDLSADPAVYIDGYPFTVIGILGNTERLPQLTLGAVVPAQTAEKYWGLPRSDQPAQMLIDTKIGAAQLIARQAPLALKDLQPQDFRAETNLNPTALQHQVQGSLNITFLILAGVAVIIGALGIANTSLVAVLERRHEIGLRRAMGATRRHITVQFLLEASSLGFVGGLVGAALGVVTTLAVTTANSWTAVMSPVPVLLAPLAGAIIGALAGIYPALRAASIEPAEALRR